MRLDAEPVPHQDRRHAGGRGRRLAEHAAGDRLGHDDGQDRRHRRPRTRRSARRPCGSSRGMRDQAEMFGYTVVEPGSVLATHLTEVVPQARRRNPHPRRHEAPGRRAEEDVAGGGRRADPRRDEAGRSAADPANAAARAGADPPVGADPGNARRLCAADQGPDPADRIRPAPAGPARSAPATATRRTGCTWSRSTRRWKTAFAPGFEHNERGLFIRMSPQAVEATCRLIADRGREARRWPTTRRSCWSARRFARR